MGGAGSQALWLQGFGVQGLVLAHWYAGPGPGLSGGQGCVQGRLWARGHKVACLLVDGAMSLPRQLLGQYWFLQAGGPRWGWS